MENVANNKNMPDGIETIEDLVQHSLNQDYNKASKVFGDLMTNKLNTALDQAKMKIAGQVYNGEPEDDGLPSDVEPETEEDTETEENEEEEEMDPNQHTHDDGTTHSHEGGDQDHSHDDEEETEVEGAAV